MKVILKPHSVRFGRSILLSIALATFSMSPAMADAGVFQAGKSYHFTGMIYDGDILILETPDNNGWARVKILSGKLKKYIGKEGFVNLSSFLTAKEIK